MSIEDLIASVNDRLTPTERRIAEVVADDPSVLAFGTVSDLAQRVATSPPSIVRFATKLGFGGFRDLQTQARAGLSQQLGRPVQRIRHTQGSLAPTRQSVADSVQSTFARMQPEDAARLAAPIVRARSVWILSGETSRGGAVALASGLAMVRPDVTLVDEHDTGRDLSCAAPGDVAVVFDFPRYRRSSIMAARMLVDADIELVAITDGPLSPLASLTSNWCGLDIPAVGPFDSAVPSVLAAELLVAEVVRQLGDDARDRIDQLEAFWETTGTFLEYTPRADRRR